MSCDAVEGKPLVHTQEPVQSALRHNRNFKPQEKGESQLIKLGCEVEGGRLLFSLYVLLSLLSSSPLETGF